MLNTNCTVNSLQSTCVALTFLMTFLALAIMLGNAVVVLAFVVDKNLRHRSNYFFLNLAISDFFVGAFSIPLYISHMMSEWNLESALCTFWLIIDYLLCTASAYNIVLISYDRYQSVSNAVSYRAKQTETWKMVVLLVSVWVLAFLVHGPLILASQSWNTSQVKCEPKYFSESYIIGITAIFEFLIPVFLVTYFNIYIYWSLWRRSSLSRSQSHLGVNPDVSSSNCGCSFKRQLFSRRTVHEPTETRATCPPEKQRRKSSGLLSLRAQLNNNTTTSKMWSLSHSTSLTLHQKEQLEILKAKKLAKSLAILVCIFAICWAPYTVATIFLKPEYHQSFWYEITFWLQWLNSFVNPILYPLCHRRFQKAFLKIFSMKKKATLPHNQSVSS
ncbi:histamine H4 receptor [Rhynchocyon petersi]